jgi:hypothetical protein
MSEKEGHTGNAEKTSAQPHFHESAAPGVSEVIDDLTVSY